jgi:2-isopropylmalate synthase
MKHLVDLRDATQELSILRSQKKYRAPFTLLGTYRLIDDGTRPEATVTIKANGSEMHEAATGVGPLDALARVLQKSLCSLFPFVESIRLVDFASRIYDAKAGTGAKVEVSIIFADGVEIWKVAAISENINMASFMALLDGFEYAILLRKNRKK